MNNFLRTLLLTTTAWAFAASAANAGTGLASLPGNAGHPPIIVAYPTDAPSQPLRIGPFALHAVWGAAPALGNGRLVLMSHGTGGSGWEQFDLAAALVAAGFTIAMPEHVGDNWHDHAKTGPESWEQRPREISQTLDAVAADARFAPLRIDFQHVGAYGMSAGGLTALTLAGARWSLEAMAQHCAAYLAEDYPACVGLAALPANAEPDATTLAAAQKAWEGRQSITPAWQQWRESRIAAVVAAVPLASPVDMASIATPHVPLGLVRAGRDLWLAPRFHIDAVHAACGERCPILADMPLGGHGSILSPQVPDLPPKLARLLNDPTSFDRASLPGIYARIAEFFRKNLGVS